MKLVSALVVLERYSSSIPDRQKRCANSEILIIAQKAAAEERAQGTLNPPLFHWFIASRIFSGSTRAEGSVPKMVVWNLY